jgi:hypothetical protein
MSKKNATRKIRRHPELVDQVFAEAGPSQINKQYKAAEEDLAQLLAWEPEQHG